MIGRRRGGAAPEPASGYDPAPDTADWISFRPGPDTEALVNILRARLRTTPAGRAAEEVTAHDRR